MTTTDMKKIKTLTFLTFLALTSCKKDRHCNCYSTTMPQLEIVPQTFRDTKKNAEKKCADFEKNSQTSSYDVKCELN